jgi:hypothetical protein
MTLVDRGGGRLFGAESCRPVFRTTRSKPVTLNRVCGSAQRSAYGADRLRDGPLTQGLGVAFMPATWAAHALRSARTQVLALATLERT